MPISVEDVRSAFGQEQIDDLPTHKGGGIDAHACADLWAESIGTTPMWDEFLVALEAARGLITRTEPG